MTQTPPMTPPDCDLRDFAFMPLEVARLRDSDLASDETPEACWAALLLWCASWHQVPSGSIPDNDQWQAKQAGYVARGRIDKGWMEIRAGALRGFVLCSDGRLYHPVVAQKALEAWNSKLKHAYERLADRTRKANKSLAEKGRPAVEIPSFDWWISAGRPEEFPAPSAGIPPEKPLKGQGQGQGEPIKGRSGTSPGGAPAPDDFAPTLAGQIGKAMKDAGIPVGQINLSDPVFVELIRQGATVEEFAGIAREAVHKGVAKAFRWVMATLQGRREEASRVALAPKVEQATPTESAYDRRMREQVAEAAGAFADVIAKPAPRAPGAPITIEAEEVIHADGIPRVEHDRAGR